MSKNRFNFTGLTLKSVFLLTITMLFTNCFKNIIKTDLYYQADFETDSVKNIFLSGFYNNNTQFGTVPLRISKYNGSKVLGFCNDNVLELDLDKLPEHYAIKIEFDLYIHDNWNNDLWKMIVNGNMLLITGFSNFTKVQQAYPNWLGNGSPLNPAGANAYTTQLPGACSLIRSDNGTSEYKICMIIQDNSRSFQMQLSDAGAYLNDPCQRSWSLDNLKITGIVSN